MCYLIWSTRMAVSCMSCIIFQIKEAMSMTFARSIHIIQGNIFTVNRSDRCNMDNRDSPNICFQTPESPCMDGLLLQPNADLWLCIRLEILIENRMSRLCKFNAYLSFKNVDLNIYSAFRVYIISRSTP